MNINMRCCAVLAALAVTCTATADIRVFVTPASQGYGLTVPENAHRPTFSEVDADGNNINAYDYFYSQHPELPGGAAGHYYSVAAYPPIDAPSGTPAAPVVIGPADWAYIWLQFQDEPKTTGLGGLIVRINGDPSGFVPTYYVQNDSGTTPAFKRWDGPATAPDYPEWHQNPQYVNAIIAGGIQNGSDSPRNMFEHQAGTSERTGVALLGAIAFTAPGLYSIQILPGELPWEPGPLAHFQYIPEPTTFALLCVTLLARRRR